MHLKVCIVLTGAHSIEKMITFHKSGHATCKIDTVTYIVPDPPVMNYEPWYITCGGVQIGEVFPLNFTEKDWYSAIKEAVSK